MTVVPEAVNDASFSPDDALASPPCGALQGRLDPASDVCVWRGIPYAQPPQGELRWRPPQPLAPWAGVRAADAFSADCPQVPGVASRATTRGEDCLYLNVWAPAGARPGSLPVLVWLPGGGFVGGSGSDPRADGQALAALGAVVVTVNYRVGLFGYLAHPGLSAESPQGVSGNYGLLDQLCALRWVQANIAAFGGDAARVTVFGVSAGSASISLMLVSPQAEGLFSRAILQSPGAGRPLASLDDAQQAGLQLGDDIRALRALDAQAVFALTGKLVPRMRGLTTPRVLRPIRDGWLLPEDDRPAMLAGRLRAMPILLGTNTDEGSRLTLPWGIRDMAAYRQLVRENFPHDEARALSLYPAAHDGEVRGRVAELFADTQFNYGTRLLARAMAAQGQPVWRYLYTRREPGQDDGPQHGGEVGHALGNLPADNAPYDEIDVALSDFMARAWVRFAATGDPNGGDARWPRYAPATDQHLDLGNSISIGSGWRAAQLDFLESVYGTR